MSTELYGPDFFVDRKVTASASAAVVVPAVCRLIDPRSVLDVGCGQGEWVEAFKTNGVRDVVGVDIAAPDWPGYLRRDLNEPLDLHREFDLVVCLEVAEHLPQSAEDTLVDSLTRHSTLVLFSAAVPGQEGIGHINCQQHEHWHGLFRDRGYGVWDEIRPLIQHRAVSPWYRENTFVYAEGTR